MYDDDRFRTILCTIRTSNDFAANRLPAGVRLLKTVQRAAHKGRGGGGAAGHVLGGFVTALYAFENPYRYNITHNTLSII